MTLSGAASPSPTQWFVENKSVGMCVQQELAWNDRAFLTAAVRGDDNSAFGADYDAAIYPKFSATRVISEESFWQDYDEIINSLRLRSAWGKAGRHRDTFVGVTLVRPEPGPRGELSVSPEVLGNPDLGPEVSQDIEVGFDAAFFDERASMELTDYNQTVTDALIDVPVSPTIGFTESHSTGRVYGAAPLGNAAGLAAIGVLLRQCMDLETRVFYRNEKYCGRAALLGASIAVVVLPPLAAGHSACSLLDSLPAFVPGFARATVSAGDPGLTGLEAAGLVTVVLGGPVLNAIAHRIFRDPR